MTPRLLRREVAVPGAAGVLASDLYLPAGHGQGDGVPTVVVRTPYGRGELIEEGMFWARSGLACLIQDVRGRFGSDGGWRPYAHERQDGRSCAEWVAAQPFSDGRLIACGSSYAAFTAWSMAVACPDRVAAVVSRVPAMGLGVVKRDPSGVLRLADHTAWWLTHGETRTPRPRLARHQLAEDPSLLARLPVSAIGPDLWATVPLWDRALGEHIDDGAELVSVHELERVPVPSLHIGGWHDVLLHTTVSHWETTGRQVRPRPARSLVIGPWPHRLTASGTTYGDRDFGPAGRIRLGHRERDWVRSVLGDAAAAESAQVFVMGENRWVDVVPPMRAHGGTRLRLYARAEGALTEHPPDARGALTFAYDPLDPCPSQFLPVDRAWIQERPDVLRFVSAPLEGEVTVFGTPRARVEFATDCLCTDVMVRLCEVTAGGAVLPIARGCAVTASGRRRVGIDLAPTAITVPRGHRWCLEITSSDFPDLARNLNTGADRYTTAHTRVATQRVHVGGPRGTGIDIPVGEPR